MHPFFIDFHCHPSMKPYGKSFNGNPIGLQSSNPRRDTSAWFYDSPNLFERGLQSITGISKFTQADFSTLAYGDVRLICASLYPIERGFFRNKLGAGIVSDLVDNFITGVGRARVNAIQNVNNYFEDVEREYQFYEQLHNQPVDTNSGNYRYCLVKNYQDLQASLALPTADRTIFVIMSIEGLHVLNNNLSAAPDEAAFLNNVRKIKAWRCPPFFVTFSHHFYNHLCGHARSLTGIVGGATDQSEGIDTGFTPLGKKVLKETLSNQNGRRIYIDVKHMSAVGRREYYKILDTEYAGQDIPVIVSHGAANGYRALDARTSDAPAIGNTLLHDDINLYDEDILRVARSKGIFGLQLDERRIAGEEAVKSVKHSVFINKIRHYRAELLWRQIQYIAELLDRNNLPAWDCMALGTDFEGVINPLNGYLTAETLVHLEEYTERYAFNYINDAGKKLKPANRISASDIVSRIFHTNGMAFIQKYF